MEASPGFATRPAVPVDEAGPHRSSPVLSVLSLLSLPAIGLLVWLLTTPGSPVACHHGEPCDSGWRGLFATMVVLPLVVQVVAIGLAVVAYRRRSGPRQAALAVVALAVSVGGAFLVVSTLALLWLLVLGADQIQM